MSKFARGVVFGLVCLASAGVAVAAEDPAAKAFGARPAVLDASLSPDGQSIALIQPLADGQANALFVARLDGKSQPKPILTSSGRPDRLTDCGWASNTRLVCQIYMVTKQDAVRMVFTRMVAVNADGTKVQELSATSNNYTLEYRQFGGGVQSWLLVGYSHERYCFSVHGC